MNKEKLIERIIQVDETETIKLARKSLIRFSINEAIRTIKKKIKKLGEKDKHYQDTGFIKMWKVEKELKKWCE